MEIRQMDFFYGDQITRECRVCQGQLADETVSSGEGPYETNWILCGDCGSWSIDRQPDPTKLNRFYSDYAKHHKKAAVNPDVNDGRRYTTAWRQTREKEYRFGLKDSGLELKKGDEIVDYGGYDGLFLDLCRSIQPGLGKTTVVDYARENPSETTNQHHNFESIPDWLAHEGKTDVLTLWDVYEHIADLTNFLEILARRVRTGGQVLIQTPRAHVHCRILGKLWHHFLPVQHLQLPSREGLLLQFNRVGFTAVQTTSFGANAPGSIIPHPYKQLFDTLAKISDLGATQIVRFVRR